MSTINIDLAADTILNVMIGQQDENEVREVVFDFSGWYTTYGSGTISLAIQRPKDEWPYEGTLTVDSTNHKATWEISETDTAYAGTGQIQLSYKVGDAKKKSVVYRFTCHKSLGALGSVVTPVQIQTFIDEVEEALQTMDGKLDDMEDEITDVKQDLNVLATITEIDPLDIIEYPYQQGYLSSGGVFTATTGNNAQKTTNAISLEPGYYKVSFKGQNVNDGVYSDVNYVRAIAVYDSSDVCTSYQQTSNLENFTVGENDSYVRINTQYVTVTEYVITPVGNTATASINDDVLIPTDLTLALENKPANAKATGDAIKDISNKILSVPVCIDLSNIEYQQGYLANNGVFTATTGSNEQKTTVAIPLDVGSYVVSFSGRKSDADVLKPRAVAVYDKNDTCIYYHLTESSETDLHFDIAESECYVRINTLYSTVYYYTLRSASSKTSNYLPYRRPTIGFIFDGEYNNNDDFAELFESFGVRCGFALQYDTTFSNNTLATYKEWYNKGFEILAHSSVGVGTNTQATDDEIVKIVHDSFFTMCGYGFDVRGFVAYQGNAKPIAISTAQKYFDYAATVNNHSGSYEGTYPDLVESNLYFNTDSPYELWRYSMQTSTLAQMKSAVDRCYNTNGLVLFYGHANSSQLQNMTVANVTSLLQYIMEKGIQIKKPVDAIKDYYSIRYQDIIS